MRHASRNVFRYLLVIVFLLQLNAAVADTDLQKPNTELTPDEVVIIVIDALKNNNVENDNGISTVFNFASPGNRSMTGPLDRFTQMIKGGFPDMLNHAASTFGEMDVTDTQALQPVWLTSRTGVETGYMFQIGKQVGGTYDGMWMTESVWPIAARNPNGQSI